MENGVLEENMSYFKPDQNWKHLWAKVAITGLTYYTPYDYYASDIRLF